MGDLSLAQVLSGASLGLNFGTTDLLVVEIGGRRLLYALCRNDGKLVEIGIAADGTLSLAGSATVTGSYAAGSEPLLSLVPTASGVRLAIAGQSEAAGQTVTLGADGVPGAQASLPGLGTLVAPQGFDLDGASALVTGRLGTGGLDLFLDAGGGFSWSDTLADSADTYLKDIAGSTSFTLGGTRYVATVSATEHGVTVIAIAPGDLRVAGAVGAPEGLPIGTPTDIGAIQRLGETLLVLTASTSSSLSLVTVRADGSPVLADHILDSPETRLQGATTLATAVAGDFAFVAAGGAEGGVSLFTALPGGRLLHLASFADDAATTLYRLSSVEIVVSGPTLDLVAASFWEPGITRLSYDISGLGAVLVADGTGAPVIGTAADDQLIGSSVAEALSGGAGDDTLSDGAGSDSLTGGPGADLFVMHGDGLTDEIFDYDRTQDRLDLSAFDFLYDVSQISVTTTADGAILDYGNETLVLHSADGAPLNAADFSNATILNVDRPPLLAVGQTLIGGAGPDTLNGGAGSDTIAGAAGDDVLRGVGGDDHLLGGIGSDTLDGGEGNDTLEGQDEADLIVGGAGDDLIAGGAGADLIYGDEYDWSGV